MPKLNRSAATSLTLEDNFSPVDWAFRGAGLKETVAKTERFRRRVDTGIFRLQTDAGRKITCPGQSRRSIGAIGKG